MKYTRRNSKTNLQTNKKQTNKQKVKKKYNKKTKKIGGNQKDYYIKNTYDIYPTGFVDLIGIREKKSKNIDVNVENIKNELLTDNLNLYNILFEKEQNKKYYGNDIEEGIVNVLLGSYEDNESGRKPKNKKTYDIEIDYKGKN